MMRYFFSVMMSVFFLATLSAQYEFKDYTFTDSVVVVPEKFQNENEIILEQHSKIELFVDDNVLKEVYLFHQKILINSDEAIERNNKVYIPFNLDEKVLVNKLRVILKNGNTIELKKSDIKEEINKEENFAYHYYAVNGLEKGAIIERMYILDSNPVIKGNTVKMQNNVPIVKSSFELIFPDHLKFKYKSYNGLPEAEERTGVYEHKTSLMIQDKNVVAVHDDEKYSNDQAHKKMWRYKLDSNTATGAKNLNNYKEYASAVYENIYVEAGKKEKKAIEKFLEDVDTGQSTSEKIRNIERLIKSTIAYNKYYNSNALFTDAIKNKQANLVDLLRLFVASFAHLGIENQMVLTCKRFSCYFDKDFETHEQLDDALFYFPEIKEFLEPETFEYRFPFINFNYCNHYGLFIKGKNFGGVTMGIGDIEYIPGKSSDVTHDVTEITVDFTKDIENPVIHTIHQQNGYAAIGLQYVKDVVPADRYTEILKDVYENFIGKADVIECNAENDGFEYIGIRPFTLNMKFHGNVFVSKAGDKLLCNVGELIGKQLELYQVKERELPVELYYTHKYTRTIRIILPEGYEIKNPEAFTMFHEAKSDDQVIALWDSKSTKQENSLVVTNTEYYNTIHYPLEVFDSYKKVVNAAADFNKIVVVLGKK